MDAYHALVRGLITHRPAPRQEGRAAKRRGEVRGPEIYAALVARQHQQPLEQMFDSLRKRIGAARFDALVTRARAQTPPRHPNPSRWARAFADLVTSDASLDVGAHALAEYAAARVECAIAPDVPVERGALRPGASLGAYEVDPRALVRDPKGKAGPAIVAIYRDDAGHVASATLGPREVAAWGLLSGEADEATLAAAGMDAAALALGHQSLAALGLLA